MNAAALHHAVRKCCDPRFVSACSEMRAALEDAAVDLRGGDRWIPRGELLTIYRDRRDLKRAHGTPWPVLEAIVEAMEESTSASLRILYVRLPGRMNAAFVNDDGTICACAALPVAETPA